MKKQLLASAAIMLAVTACGSDEPSENEPKPGEIIEEGAEDTGDAASRAGEEISAAAGEALDEAGDFVENELSQSNARGFTVRNIIGESVRGDDNAAIGVIDDLLFDDTWLLRAVVLKDGSFLGLGGEPATIGADRFAFSVNGEGDVAVRASLTDGELRQMTKSLAYQPSDGAGFNPGNYVSIRQLMKLPVDNENGDKVADPFDVILMEPGRFHKMIISVGGLGAIGNRLVAIEMNNVLINTDRGSITISGAPDFDSLPTFEY